jgi:hypothetical protein
MIVLEGAVFTVSRLKTALCSPARPINLAMGSPFGAL